ncbi:hypothetical protein G9P44_000592 [Scheffersomyces stipitis]|nr:hypothetical protein G9P44_000592 [Scheffersomyces stipitis]
MIVEKRDHLERMEMAKPMRSLIDDLTSCSIKELPAKLEANLKWEKPRGDLLHWVSVLNRMDEIYEEIINKYDLENEFPRLQLFSQEEQTLICSCLKFTYILLDHCSDRQIYSSSERIFALLNTPTIDVRLHALEVAVLISEKYAQSSSSRYSAPKQIKNKVLQMARSYPPIVPPSYAKAHQEDPKAEESDKPSVMGDHFNFIDTLSSKKKYPSKWKSLEFPYYKTVLVNDQKKSQQPGSDRKKSEKTDKSDKSVHRSEGLSTFHLSEESVRKLTLEQIYDKASDSIPKDSWFEFGLVASVTKAFNTRSYESIKLREKLLQIKCLAIGFVCCMCSSQFTSSRLFEAEPYIFSFLVDLVSPTNDDKVSTQVYYAATRALECISSRKLWGSDIIRCMGGNVNHGILFQCIRHINKMVRSEDPIYFERGYIHFFNMLGNLINSKNLIPRLTSGGILNDLMSFFDLRTKYRWSCSAAVHLTSNYLKASPDSFEEFVNKDGFNLLINTIRYEVNFALQNPDYDGGAPTDAVVHYSISFRQANYIKNLMKLVSDLIQSDSGDRLRNLFDSPLLESFNQVLLNPEIFGPLILSTTIDSVFFIIHNEPTAFSILNEAKVVDTILDNFHTLFIPSGNLLVSLPEVIGAICLNNDGLKKVKEKGTISTFFQLFQDLECSKELVRSDMATNMGCSFDELGRHYPSLKPVILDATKKLIEDIVPYANEKMAGARFYTSSKGALYYSEEEEIIENEEGKNEIENWDSTDMAYILDNVFFFLGGLLQDSGQWGTDSMKVIPFQLWLNFLTMPNAPFDYITSNGVSTLLGILKYFDDEGREYGFPELFSRLKEQLENPIIQEFLNFDDPSVSFFSRFEEEEEMGTMFIQEFNILHTLLYIMTEIYVNPISLFHERFQQVLNVFGGTGLSTVTDVGLLLKRVVLEETIIRTNLPLEVCKQTERARSVAPEIPPLPICASEPSSKSLKQDFTSSKFKNTLQLRTFNHNFQTYTSSIFCSLGRVCSSKRPDFALTSWRRDAVALTIEVGRVLSTIFDVQIDNEYYWECYVLNIATVVLYSLTLRDRIKDSLYTSLAISLFQNGFFEKLKDFAHRLWMKILQIEPEEMKKTKEYSYISRDESSVVKNALNSSLAIFVKCVNTESFSNIPSAKLYFHTGYGKDADNRVTCALLVQIRLVALEFFQSIIGTVQGPKIPSDSQQVLETSGLVDSRWGHPENIPSPVMEQVISIAKHVYLGRKETLDAEFIPLHVSNVSPPAEQVSYLVSLGMTRSEADHYFRHLQDVRDIANKKWPDCPQFDISEEQWEKYGQMIREENANFDLTFPTYRKSSELRELRKSGKNSLVVEFLAIAKQFPRTVDAINEFFLTIFVDVQEVVGKIFESIVYLVDIQNDKGQNLAVSIHLLQLLLRNERWSRSSGPIYEKFATFIASEIENHGELINEDYFSHSLTLFEQILVFRDFPVPEPTEYNEIKYNDIVLPFVIDEEKNSQIFEGILNLKNFTSMTSVIAVTRILVLYARNETYVMRIIKSDLFKELITLPKLLSKNVAGVELLKTPLVILIRRCLETTDVLHSHFAEEVRSQFGSSFKRTKDLRSFLREAAPCVMRNPEAFVDYISTCIRLEGYDGHPSFFEDKLPIVRIKTQTVEDVEMSEADEQKPVEEQKVLGSSGVMYILLKNLMEAVRSDWTTDTTEESNESVVTGTGNYNYICFLVKTIAELLGSYKQSKLEFLTFSRKPNTDEKVKPRPTALNFFIHQLIPKHSLEKPSVIELSRRSMVSALAKLAITSLVSTPLLTEKTVQTIKDEDIEMSYIRKYFVEILSRIFKDTANSSAVNTLKYGKLADLFELCSSVISTKYREEGGLQLDSEGTKWDIFFITKALLEKQIPGQITSIVADLDLNYPDIDKVIKASLKTVTAIAKAKVEDSEVHEGEHQGDKEDDDIVPEEVDDREETPDLFRNSTLGMYDVDFDSDEEEDELDYFEEGPLEVLMSGEDISASEDSSGLSDLDSDMEDEDIEDGYQEVEDINQDVSEDELNEDLDSEGSIDDIEIIDELDLGSHSDRGDNETEEGDNESTDASDFYDFEDDGEVSEYDSEVLDGWIEEFEREDDSANEGDESDLLARLGRNIMDGTRRRSRNADDNDNESSGSISDSEGDDLEFNPSNINRSVLDSNGFPSPALAVLLDNFFRDADFAVQVNGIETRFDGNRDGSITRYFENVMRNRHKSDSDPVSHIHIKSVKDRWNDYLRIFYPNKNKDAILFRAIPGIVNRIESDSIDLFRRNKEEADRKRKEREDKRRQQEEEERKRKEEEAHERELHATNTTPHEPVIVRIADREVDISGTDIDPEFFEALPDDMREEVFTQHVRERRANATSTGSDAREIDPDFLNALPDQIRDEILQQEELARDYGIHERLDSGESEDEQEEWYEEPRFYSRNEETEETKKPKSRKVFYTPLVDRQGVSALVRILFAPLTINQRENVFHTLQYLCYSKQTRLEVMSMLIAILHECFTNQRTIEKIYAQICSRASGSKEIKKHSHLPVGSTTISIGIQIIEAVDYLLERNTHLRYYILTEHENPFILKKVNKKLKLKDFSKEYKYSINYLMMLLENNLVKNDQTFMDILARVLQISTRPLHVLQKLESEGEKNEKKQAPPFPPPVIPNSNFRQIIKILTANECSNTTFRRTISAMQNLSVLSNAQNIFSLELSEQAAALGLSIVGDLKSLTTELTQSTSFNTESKSFGKFSAASSDQAKLLRILTALDYMFESREKDRDIESDAAALGKLGEIQELTDLYKKLGLGNLWDALSDCLRELEDKQDLANVATALLPLIEALMVVCKHSKVRELQIKDVVKYEAKKIDFTKEPIERLFFSFTDEHKKILNQMVRTNPNLMSGPFGMLVRNPRVLEFDNKKNYFDRKLHLEKNENSKLSINVRREQVFLDSYRSLFFKSKDEFRNSKLEINFKGESGVDAGGVTREWYQVLSRQMFNPDYALFSPVASDETTFHPNRTSYVNPEHLSFFKFIGRVIGKAIYDNCYLDCHFSRAVYKRILGRPVSLKDMETLDLEYFKSLMWMLENDITDVITEDFSVETDDYGEHKIIDLIPNGRNIPVTEENKHDYVKKVVEYRLQTSVAEQMDNFLIGFHEIIPKELVAIFDEQELELLISGLPDISVIDWQSHTTYNNYSPSSLQIQWFWRAVKSFDNEERAKLLQFATGTSKVPLNGFKELSGANGTCKFSIHRDYGSTERLPSSHTCFNQIDLPAYETYETLRGSLLLAITEGHEGFGLA